MTVLHEPTAVEIGPQRLQGLLAVPDEAKGIVIFAHGSGSGRMSPRNNHVAEGLQRAGLATLLIDLLTPDEERHRGNVFDIDLLATRVDIAAMFVSRAEQTDWLPIGLFGASTGAAAALVAAARHPEGISAVVSRGGRPDLAGAALDRVKAPTLLIVGGDDTEVIGLNRSACERIRAEKELVIVPGATHLFEEPGKLDDVVRLASRWFLQHLPRK